jgi:hypothetical protein
VVTAGESSDQRRQESEVGAYEREPVELDGVASLRDVEAEAGDEAGLSDSLDLDAREARELGVNLDAVASEEAELD